jgi:glutamate-1-semialdehyde 2,1-aminomutase
MMRELKALAGGFGLPLRVQGFGQAFHVSFGPDTPIENYRDLCERDADRYHAFAEHLADHGLWVASRGIWYVSAAHGDDEFDATLERVQSAMESFS